MTTKSTATKVKKVWVYPEDMIALENQRGSKRQVPFMLVPLSEWRRLKRIAKYFGDPFQIPFTVHVNAQPKPTKGKR